MREPELQRVQGDPPTEMQLMKVDNIPGVVKRSTTGRLFVRISNEELGLGKDVDAETDYVPHATTMHFSTSKIPEKGFKTRMDLGAEVRIALLGPFTERGSRFISVKRIPYVGSRPTDAEIWAEALVGRLDEKPN